MVAPQRGRRDRSRLYKQHGPDRPRARRVTAGKAAGRSWGLRSTGRAALQRAGGGHGLSGDEAARARAKQGPAVRRPRQDQARPSMGRCGDGQTWASAGGAQRAASAIELGDLPTWPPAVEGLRLPVRPSVSPTTAFSCGRTGAKAAGRRQLQRPVGLGASTS
jgi:hypothetical protein